MPAAPGKAAQHDAKAGNKTGRKAPKWDPTQPRKVGPVFVQILDHLPSPTASGTGPDEAASPCLICFPSQGSFTDFPLQSLSVVSQVQEVIVLICAR